MQTNETQVLGAETPAASEATQARGSFDLRSSVEKNPQNMKYWAIAGVVVVVLLFALGGLWALALSAMNEGNSEIDESKVQADTMLKGTVGNDDAMRIAREAKARKLADEEEAARRKKDEQAKPDSTSAGKQTPPPQNPPSKPSGQAQGTAPAPMTALERKLGGGVYLKNTAVAGSSYGQPSNGGRQSSPSGASADADDADLLGSNSGSSGSSRNSLLSNLSSTGFKPTKAFLAPPGKYLLRHNTYARCALYTAIKTDYPGQVECNLTEPLYSADGSTVIAEAGARLTGEQRVDVRPGQTSVFTNWTELETSSGTPGVPGVRARLDSMGAGQMGESGTTAWIDNHYMQRYGGAVMLSAFQDVLSAAANSTQKSGSGYTVNNSEQNVENMASKALDANINVNPTGYLLPATVLTVIVARDIDFSSVYENR